MAYEINININGDFEEKEDGVSQSTATKPTEQQKAQKALGKYVASQTIEPFLQNVKTQITQNIQTITGNSELQQRVNFGFEMAQFGVNSYKNAKGGAVVAAAAGIPLGVGALIGVSLTAINTAIQIAFNGYQINLQKRMENYQLQQTRDRQGIAYNKSRR